MAKRIFISFAKEDSHLRDLLVGQARNKKSPFEFVDMSVKQPWDNAWKTNCRTKIKGCDGLIAILTKNSKDADGEIWEIDCALEEGVPAKAIWGSSQYRDTNLPIKGSIKIMDWTWDNIANWINSL